VRRRGRVERRHRDPCGDPDADAARPPPAHRRDDAAPATTTTATTTTTTQATTAAKPHTSTTSTSPESQPGGAGDETGIRVPATFTIRNGRLSPPSIGLPAFLRISFGVRNLDANAHRVVFRGHTLAVPAHGSASVLVTGLKKGSYPVTLDGRRRALIVTGVQAGP